MPELPEVETVVREIRPHLLNQVIGTLRRSKQALRHAWSPKWRSAVVGQRVAAVKRHGKWIFIPMDNGRTLVIHLGMTGQLTVKPSTAPRESHTHVVLGLNGTGNELRFRDVRRFGSVELLDDNSNMERHVAQIGLGPEPFHVPADYWREQLSKTRRCVKAVLLDQRVVAGVGNIYADESCFAAKLHPGRLGCNMTTREIGRLAAAVPDVLTRAIEKRGSTIRDYIGGSGLRGGFQDEFCVYGRTGAACVRCNTLIRHTRLVGRSTHYCPRCQKA